MKIETRREGNSAFSEVQCLIFDSMLNIKRPYDSWSILETLSVMLQKSRDYLENEWNKLVESGYIIKKDYWIINPTVEHRVREIVRTFLERKGITLDFCTREINKETEDQTKLILLIKLAGRISEWKGEKSITFIDYEWVNDLGQFCEKLVKKRIMFRQTTSSRRHSYRTYILRAWPFDVKDIILNVINKQINVKGLNVEDWRLIFLLLLSSNLRLKYETIKSNMNDLTEPELREIITHLKRRGILEESYDEVYLLRGLKEPLLQYFNTNIYPQIKRNIIENLKRKISKSLANLWIFAGIKRLSDLPIGEEQIDPFPIKLIEKSKITDAQLLSEAKKLKLISELDNKISIHVDILDEIENWLKSSIRENLIYIPADDIFKASSILRDIFSKCEEYVKIQDPYIDEETFYILKYIPTEIKIQLLTGIKIGWKERDMDRARRICKWIERLKNERRGKFEILFLGKVDTGDAPFHDRFIISKNKCWQIGTSLKQIGRGKDTVINELSKREKEELIEPAFERWWNASPKELKKKNLIKLTFQEWKKRIEKRAESL